VLIILAEPFSLPFSYAIFVRLSRTSIAYEMRGDHRRRVLGDVA
jgi:hypothetical protein